MNSEKAPSRYEEHRARLKFVTVEGGEMAYIDEGDGPAILLVHGVPTSSWLYRHIIPELVDGGFRVIAPDLLGYGGSDKPRGSQIYQAKKQGLRLLDLMRRHLKIRAWIHVCHDVGGLWTWEMLLQDKKGIAGLVILNTIIYEEGFKPPMRFEPGWAARFYTNLYRWRLSSGLMVNLTLKNGLKHNNILKASDRRGYKAPMREGGNRAIYHFFTQTCNALPDNYRELLRDLNRPAMVIWGVHDPMLKWEPQAAAVSADLDLDSGNIHQLKDAGHFIQEEKPREIAAFIRDFTTKVYRS